MFFVPKKVNLLVFWIVLEIIAQFSNPLFAEVKISSSEKAFIKNHATKLKPYVGERPKVWEEFIRIATKYKYYHSLEAIFSVKEIDGAYATQYAFDLFEIFKKTPLFFLQSANKFYKGNLDCVTWWLVNETQDTKFSDVEKVIKEAISANPKYDLLGKFYDKAKAQYSKLGKEGQFFCDDGS